MAGLAAATNSGDLSGLLAALIGSKPAGLLGTGVDGTTTGTSKVDGLSKAITDALTKAITDSITSSATTGTTSNATTGSTTNNTVSDTTSKANTNQTVTNTADISGLQQILSNFSPNTVTSRTQAGVDYQTNRLLQGPLLNFINAQNSSGGYGGVNPYLSQIVTDAAGQGALLSNQAVQAGGTLSESAAAAIAGATKTTGTVGTAVTGTVGSTVASGTNTSNTTGSNTSNTTGTNHQTTDSSVKTTQDNTQSGTTTSDGTSKSLTKTPLNLSTALAGAGVVLAPSAFAAVSKLFGDNGIALDSSAGVGSPTDAVVNDVNSGFSGDVGGGSGIDLSTSDIGVGTGASGTSAGISSGVDEGGGLGIGDISSIIGAASGNPLSIIKTLSNVGGIMDGAGDIADTVAGWLDTVICTELHRQELLPTRIYRLAGLYAAKNFSKAELRGYHLWAVPYVRVMRKSKLATKLVQPFFIAYAKQASFRISRAVPESYDTWLGRAFLAIVPPICGVLGRGVGAFNGLRKEA